MIQRQFIFVATVVTSSLIFGCSNKGHAPSVSGISLPQITSPVKSTALFSVPVSVQAVTGAPLNSQTCSTCGSSTAFSTTFSLASLFALQGKLADSNACMISAISQNGVVPDLTSGVYKYMYSSGQSGSASNIKAKVTVVDGVVTSYELFQCMSGSQIQYMSGTNNAGNVTFTFRGNGGQAGSLFVTMDATGTMSGTDWTSKTLNVGFNMTTLGNYSWFSIVQQSDYLDISGVVDTGTLGTLDANDIRIFSRAQLLGNSLRTYALGDGSIIMATGSGSSNSTNWNGDTGVEGSGPTTYDSVVAAATLPSVPTSRTSNFTTDETWDCQLPADAVNYEEAAMSNDSFKTSVMACMEAFQ